MATLRLSDLLEGVPGVRVEGDARTPIQEVRDDSRLVGPGDLFVAVAGTKEDGRRFIQTAIERGAAAVLGAPSQALEQGRVHGCAFRVAALTNVTLDHLDYHGTQDAYFAAKSILFRELLEPGTGTAVMFVDREDGRRMLAEVRARALTV